jgi:hypothetical protein
MDDFEPDLVGTGAGAAGAELLAQGKIKSLLSVKATSYAKRAVDFAFASLTPVADRGNFSNESIDPIDQLDEQIDALATDVSSSENITLILSLGVWRKIRMHPKVKARVQGIKTALSRDQFLDTLLLPVNLEISSVSATETKWGQSTVNKGSLVGNYAILLYSQPNPGLYDPSRGRRAAIPRRIRPQRSLCRGLERGHEALLHVVRAAAGHLLILNRRIESSCEKFFTSSPASPPRPLWPRPRLCPCSHTSSN